MFRQLLAFWIVSFSPCIVCAADTFPVATPESQGVSTAAVRRLAGEIEAYVKDGTIVGGELLIIKNRKTILREAFGDRDREDKRAMERGTIFNVRSMTKPLTGVAVQMLADDGKLSLDDAVAKHLPAFDNDKSKAITIRQLLQHRSGLPLTILKLKLDEHADLQAQAAAIGKEGPQFKPGEKFWYSDAGSDAAAAVVEKISGKTIDRFIAERILQPLGMADSFYLSKKADDPRKKDIASLYIGTPGKWNRFWKPSDAPFYPFAWGSQSMYSTTMDYARFLALWMDGGMVGEKRLLSKDAIARILTPESQLKALGTDRPYPCGFFGLMPHYGQMSMLYAPGERPSRMDVKAFGHGGSDGTGAWAFPAENLIVCYFTQSRGQLTTIRLETTIQDALLPGDGAKPTDEMKPLLGTYHATFGPFKNAPFHVVFRCGKLALDIPSELVYELKPPDKDGRWLVASGPTAISFKKDAAGNVTALLMHRVKGTEELPRAKPEEP
jgi:CubicO group peptidase (beta-lactamase class C family)